MNRAPEHMSQSEFTILEVGNHAILTPAYPEPVSYIRVVERTVEVGDDGPSTVEREVAYWDRVEWQEDPLMVCMGAILASIGLVARGAFTEAGPIEENKRRIS